MSEKKYSVIIATAGDSRRADSLTNAIKSIELQEGASAEVIVVFNGPNVDENLFTSVSSRESVRVERLAEPSLPQALNYGRSCVSADYFSFLDDDDEYLPDALSKRGAILESHPEVDVVASNGYVKSCESKELLFAESLDLSSDSMKKLFDKNWLTSCGGLYRTSSVDDSYFRIDAKYFEWTMTAFLLSFDKSVVWLNEPTFVINKLEESLSTSIHYVEAYPKILEKMLGFTVSNDISIIIRNRLSKGFHSASEECVKRGLYSKAWKYHLKSMIESGGIKYLPYTRKLIFHYLFD